MIISRNYLLQKFYIGTIYALLRLQYQKGKLCENRGRKVTDLTGKRPKMAGLPDNASRLSHICDYEYQAVQTDAYRCSSVLLILRRNQE